MAASLQWDANGGAGGSGGTGPWNTSGLTWFNGTTYQAWNNAVFDDAVFGGTAGTVTLGGAITVHNVSFATSGYTVTGSTLTLGGVTPTVDVSTGTATIASVLAGTAGLAKTGAGTLTLTGTNTYTGGTTISAGTLQIGSGGTAGSIGGDIVDNSALIFNRSNGLTYGGTISGTGTLTKLGAGALTLTGDHSFTGTTTISAGTLIIGSGGTTGSLVGNIVDNATLTFNRSDDVTYGGVDQRHRHADQAGPGTLTFTGDNSYTGATTISAGTLQIGNGGTSGAVVGNIANAGALIFNRSNALTYGGIISGAGSVTKLGAGTLTLTGANTYTGGTTITAGTLQVGKRRGNRQPGRQYRRQFRAGLQPQQYADLCRGHQRDRFADPGRHRHADADRRSHLHRRHDDLGRDAERRQRQHHRQPDRQYRQQFRANLQSQQCADLWRDDQRYGHPDQSRQRRLDLDRRQHLRRHDDDQRRIAHRRRRRHHRQPGRQHRRQCHADLQPQRRRHLWWRHQRHRGAPQAGSRNADLDRRQHLRRHDDDQRRNAASRQWRDERGGGRQHRQCRGADLQPQQPAQLRRGDQRRRDAEQARGRHADAHRRQHLSQAARRYRRGRCRSAMAARPAAWPAISSTMPRWSSTAAMR